MTWFRSSFAKLVLLLCGLVLCSALGFYWLEAGNLAARDEGGFLTAVYWAVVTLTTVGYGDLVPVTPSGRILGIVVMISGFGFLSTLTGSLASLLVERQARKRKGLLPVKLSGHVILYGWNSYAPKLIGAWRGGRTHEASHLVLVNELPEDKREEVAFKLDLKDLLHFVHGSPAQESVVARSSPATAKAAYILSQAGLEPKAADQQSIYAALTIRGMAPKLPLYGEVMLAENREHLQRAGVDEIVSRGELSSLILGLMGSNPSVWPFFQYLIGARGHGALGYRHLTKEDKALGWRELCARLRGQDGTLPVALCRDAQSLNLQDLLDEGSALDAFVLELFAATGHRTQLGQQGRRVLVNPADEEALASFDGILYLKPSKEHA